ncbi:hypothetical protein [Flavobacterium sp. 7A]|uniref:hypothetical protein n=1 Tax=Flavobacterium sp. 7A TaxID=2940571 RepID=UPI002227504A|nr:hypothetical protein [Flavobacterium sp. 7A]MCW2119126.1 hypothetical protein [Flavobacterium sp. 7A]
MSKINILIKIKNEVHFFTHHIISAVLSNDFKKTFLILSQNPILDREQLRNYLIENRLNKSALDEVDSLLAEIDLFFGFEKRYNDLPVQDCISDFSYGEKGVGSIMGTIKYSLLIKGRFLSSDKKTFDERISEFNYLNQFAFGKLFVSLYDIKNLLEKRKFKQKLDKEVLVINPISTKHNAQISATNSFYNEILNDNKFDRQKKIKKKTNKYDKLLLIEFITEFTEFTIKRLFA